MHPLNSEKLDDIIRFCRERGAKRLEIFGSAARGDDFDPATSDAGFLVEVNEWARKPWRGEFLEFESALWRSLGRKVDLMSLGVLQHIGNRFRRRSIERDRELFYAG